MNIFVDDLEEENLPLGVCSINKNRASFTKMKAKFGYEHKQFHDVRHEAATRIARVVSITLQLSAVKGHKRLEMLKS